MVQKNCRQGSYIMDSSRSSKLGPEQFKSAVFSACDALWTTSNAGRKPSKKFQCLCFLLKGGEGTSAAQPIDEPHTSPEDHTVRGGLLESNHGIDDPKDELISPEKLKFTEAISKAMAKELAPLIANRDQTAVRPTLYRGSKDGTVEEWLLVMKRYLERVYSNALLSTRPGR